MTFIDNQTEEKIFNFLMMQQTKFVVNGIELTEKPIEGTKKERERECRRRAKELAKIVESC